jgi:type IV pilus assembly protein PilZ
MTDTQPPATINPAAPAKPGVLSLAIREKAALFAAYMPFVKGGGLFVPTSRPFKMGEEVFMLLTLLDDPHKLKIVGKVIWLTPQTVNNKPQGMGIQFNDKDGGIEAKKRIETILGAALKSSRPTHTI